MMLEIKIKIKFVLFFRNVFFYVLIFFKKKQNNVSFQIRQADSDKYNITGARNDFSERLYYSKDDRRRPDWLIMQFGFDLLPNDYDGHRIQLSGWDYWKDGNRLKAASPQQVVLFVIK